MPVPANPAQPGANPPQGAPSHVFSVVPRTSAGFNQKSFDLGGETAIVVTGGVILMVRASDGSDLVDMEADRLVFWTRGNAQELLSNMRTSHGSGRELEFYLSGNVQIRSKRRKEDRFLQADEVYYDVGRNVAIALRAHMEIHQPRLPYPLNIQSDQIIQQNPKLLETGRTDLLTGFVSKKGRKFKAFLVKQPDGRIGFEFQPRAPKEKPPAEKPIRRGSAPRARSTR